MGHSFVVLVGRPTIPQGVYLLRTGMRDSERRRENEVVIYRLVFQPASRPAWLI